MTAQQHYDGLDSEQVGETREETQMLSQCDYVALGGWVKSRQPCFPRHDVPNSPRAGKIGEAHVQRIMEECASGFFSRGLRGF